MQFQTFVNGKGDLVYYIDAAAGFKPEEEPMIYEQYNHHGKLVWVRSSLKGEYKEFCLCYACKRFHPNEDDNCLIAEENYALDKKYSLVTPVFECPVFQED
jgi:hypothetical protein